MTHCGQVSSDAFPRFPLSEFEFLPTNWPLDATPFLTHYKFLYAQRSPFPMASMDAFIFMFCICGLSTAA